MPSDRRVAAYNIPAEKIDGMDVLKVYETTHRAFERIRSGGGPQFIECETYRYRGHSMADPGTYRPAIELKAHEAWDPISAAIREVEFRYPSQAELAAAGPDNVPRRRRYAARHAAGVAAADGDRTSFTLGCDHRVLAGADAARFLQTLAEILAKPKLITETSQPESQG